MHDFLCFSLIILSLFLSSFACFFHYSDILILIVLVFSSSETYFCNLIHISILIVPFFSNSRSIHPFCFLFLRSLFLFHYSVTLYLTVLRNFIFIPLFSYIFLQWSSSIFLTFAFFLFFPFFISSCGCPFQSFLSQFSLTFL